MGIIGITFLIVVGGISFCVFCIVKPHAVSKISVASSGNHTPQKRIDIDRAMAYPFTRILKRYQKDYGVSEEVAREHERELKRFLIVGAENHPGHTDMFSPAVDDLWHTFLLFTREYKYFCEEILGQFIHHVPKIEEEIPNTVNESNKHWSIINRH